MKTAVIIEDELIALNLLKEIIKEYCDGINIVGCASNIMKGKELIESTSPDIVFLDIRLQNKTGFQLLDSLKRRSFRLIITTAYEKFALEAFKYNAIDYILKPYSPTDVKKAVDRVIKKKEDEKLFEKLSDLIQANDKKSNRITVSTEEGLYVLEISEILRLQSNQSYSKVFMKDENNILTSKSLNELHLKLPGNKFYRVHNSHVVNIDFVRQISNEDGGYLIMSDGSQVPIARRRKQDFLAVLNGQT